MKVPGKNILKTGPTESDLPEFYLCPWEIPIQPIVDFLHPILFKAVL